MKANDEFRLGDEADSLFNELMDMHDGLDEERSRRLDAGLILILMNRLGDAAAVREAMAEARAAIDE